MNAGASGEPVGAGGEDVTIGVGAIVGLSVGDGLGGGGFGVFVGLGFSLAGSRGLIKLPA